MAKTSAQNSSFEQLRQRPGPTVAVGVGDSEIPDRVQENRGATEQPVALERAGLAAVRAGHAPAHGPGVRYLCQRCTACCRWPGDVILTEADIGRISRFLGLAERDFIQRHTRLGGSRRHLSLHEKPDGSCAFLDGNDCSLQPVKPEQCEGFPNRWVFPGWRDVCEAVPVAVEVDGGGAAGGAARLSAAG